MQVIVLNGGDVFAFDDAELTAPVLHGLEDAITRVEDEEYEYELADEPEGKTAFAEEVKDIGPALFDGEIIETLKRLLDAVEKYGPALLLLLAKLGLLNK